MYYLFDSENAILISYSCAAEITVAVKDKYLSQSMVCWKCLCRLITSWLFYRSRVAIEVHIFAHPLLLLLVLFVIRVILAFAYYYYR